MIALATLLLVLVLSLLVTRVASVALMHTGLSAEVAKFQARSAFTGAGFTTTESERVVSHPVRRKILGVLMVLGNAGIITAVSSLILTFVQPADSGQPVWVKAVLMVSGILLLWTLVTSDWVDRHLSRLIERLLGRYTDIEIRDYANILGLSGDYAIVEMHVSETHWLAGRIIDTVRPRDEGIVVLGIQRADGEFLGAPRAETRIRAEDTLVLYGRRSALARLGERKSDAAGDSEHERAVAEQQDVEQRERRIDRSGEGARQ